MPSPKFVTLTDHAGRGVYYINVEHIVYYHQLKGEEDTFVGLIHGPSIKVTESPDQIGKAIVRAASNPLMP